MLLAHCFTTRKAEDREAAFRARHDVLDILQPTAVIGISLTPIAVILSSWHSRVLLITLGLTSCLSLIPFSLVSCVGLAELIVLI
jgi:hypothetical protein